jgi:hypothetical protein
VSYYALWHFLQHEGMTFKKAFAPPNRTVRTSPARERWKARQATIDPRRLVFIDETPRVKPGGQALGQNQHDAHRWPMRQRPTRVAKTPFGRWRTLTFLAALGCDGLTAPRVIDGPINGTSFRAYVEQVLAPILAPGDIVVMDNLGSHKGRAIRAVIRAAQAKLFFPPPTRQTSIQSSSPSPK